MADDLYIEMQEAQFKKTGQASCGDSVRYLNIEKENRYIAALSDGLGSGIKANVLSTMTTVMALRFLASDMPTLSSVEIMMDSLPVCEVRKISYATFSLFDFTMGGNARILEMGNPSYIHLRGTEEVPPLMTNKIVSSHWPDRIVREAIVDFQPGDRIIICSDGVTQAGLGERADMRLGWRRSGVMKFAQRKIAESSNISASELSFAIARESVNITKGICRDDVSCLVIYMRHPRVMRVLTGPPFRKENDAEFASYANLGEAHTVVCGGTTANILERETGHKVKITLGDMRQSGSLPPKGRMEDVALVTEGILTLGRVLSALEEKRPIDDEPPAARAILEMFRCHARNEFIVGTKVNESHQDPNIPQDLELRRGVVRRIVAELETKYRKKTKVQFY